MYLPFSEVMDKMPPLNHVVWSTAVLAGLLVLAAAWRPVLGTLAVLAIAFLLPWFEPSLDAAGESYNAGVGGAMRREDPAYFAFSRTILWTHLIAAAVGSLIWWLRRHFSKNRKT